MSCINHDEDVSRLQGKCPLCSQLLIRDPEPDPDDDLYWMSCLVCGKYGITKLVLSARVLEFASDAKPLLSAIVRRHFEMKGQPETITSDNWEALVSQAPHRNDVPGKVRCLLGYIAHKSQFPSDEIEVNCQTDYPICFAANKNEFKFYVKYANEAGFLGSTTGMDPTQRYWLKAKGWEETWRILTLDSPYAFVAMAFSKEGERGEFLTKAFQDAIKPAIEQDAGYEEAIRIDKEEFLGDIVFEIIARIKECRFVVADVTNSRNAVYFEGGYAMGMDLPVIWTCHKDDMDKLNSSAFDTSHLSHIVWDTVEELREKLKNRILATIGRGPKRKTSD
jgi:hypothetical protein